MRTAKLFGWALAIAATGLLASAPATAMAAKPKAPISIECTKTSQAGDTYSLSCSVTPVGSTPEDVNLLAPDESVYKLLEVKKPAGGVGKWVIGIAVNQEGGLPIRFEATYKDGTRIKVAIVFSPSGQSAAKAPKRGKITTGEGGKKIQSFPSE